MPFLFTVDSADIFDLTPTRTSLVATLAVSLNATDDELDGFGLGDVESLLLATGNVFKQMSLCLSKIVGSTDKSFITCLLIGGIRPELLVLGVFLGVVSSVGKAWLDLFMLFWVR